MTTSPKQSWADISDDGLDDQDVIIVDVPRKNTAPSSATSTEASYGHRHKARGRAGSGRHQIETSWSGKATQRKSFERQWSSKSSPKGSDSTLSPQAETIKPEVIKAMPKEYSPMGSFSVKVEGMPVELCSDACVDAMLHQAGLQDFIIGFDISSGVADIHISTWHASMRCYNHFATSSWSTGALKVHMKPMDSPTTVDGNVAWPQGEPAVGVADDGTPFMLGKIAQNGRGDSMDNTTWNGYYATPGYECYQPYSSNSYAHEMALAHAYAHANAQAGVPRRRVPCS